MHQKRIAYIGLSSPLFYDFSSQGDKLPTEQSSPNPILDGPFGIFLLFDEIWFISRALCPRNLRDAHFVRFLDEEGRLPTNLNAFKKHLSEKREIIIANCFSEHQIRKFSTWSTDYEKTVRQAGIDWDAAADNHSHGLKVGDTTLSPNSANIENVIFDLALIKTLAPERPELITNTFTHSLFDIDTSPTYADTNLGQSIIITDITSFLEREGPYHPCIDNVREIPELIDFRHWIASQPKTIDPKDLKNRSEEIRRRIDEEKKKVFLKYLSHRNQIQNLAKTVGSTLVDLLLPGSGLVADMTVQLAEIQEIKKQQWQAFVLQSDAILR